jgi:hypothetical protein
MGKLAFLKCRKRVRDQGKTASGAPVPKLRRVAGPDFYKVPLDDLRFTSGGSVRRETAWGPDNWVRIYNNYGKAKIAKGRRPRKDGFLTGGMWSMPGLKIVKKKTVKGRGKRKYTAGGGMLITIRGIQYAVEVYFAGSSITGGFRTLKSGKRKPKTYRNRKKAEAVGRRSQSDKNPAWRLLELNDKEWDAVQALWQKSLAL